MSNMKQAIVINQASTTAAGTATGYVDTKGWDFVDIDVITTTSNAVTNNPSVLKITEGDTTVVSNASAITGFTGDTDFTIPDAVTSGDWGVKFRVDCRSRKRYLHVSVSPLTTQSVTAIANLSKGDTSAENATDAGVKALVEG